MNLYRGRFIIGIYALEGEGETCLAVCESVKEFAKLINKSETSARMMIYKMEKGRNIMMKVNCVVI